MLKSSSRVWTGGVWTGEGEYGLRKKLQVTSGATLHRDTDTVLVVAVHQICGPGQTCVEAALTDTATEVVDADELEVKVPDKHNTK